MSAAPRRVVRAVVLATDAVAIAGLVALAVIAGWTILGRALFDLSGGGVALMLPGAIELTRHALALTVLAALPGALGRGLVRVDLLAARLPERVGRALMRLWHAALAGIGGLAAWRLAEAARREAASGALTQDLALPAWPLPATAALALGLVALVAVALALAPADA